MTIGHLSLVLPPRVRGPGFGDAGWGATKERAGAKRREPAGCGAPQEAAAASAIHAIHRMGAAKTGLSIEEQEYRGRRKIDEKTNSNKDLGGFLRNSPGVVQRPVRELFSVDNFTRFADTR